jgi:hypothetical protein
MRRRSKAQTQVEPAAQPASLARTARPASGESVWLPSGSEGLDTASSGTANERAPSDDIQRMGHLSEAPHLPPWMKIAQGSPQSSPLSSRGTSGGAGTTPDATRGTQSVPDDPAARWLQHDQHEGTEGAATASQHSEPQLNQWLPPALQHEENPLATGTWLPAEASARPEVGEPSVEPEEERTRKPVPHSSWLPSELVEPTPASSGWHASGTGAPSLESAAETASVPGRSTATNLPSSESTPSQPGLPNTEVAGSAPRFGAAQDPSASTELAAAAHHPSAVTTGDETAAYGLRSRAVRAYCRELLGPESAITATQEILGSLTGAIGDSELLQTTRIEAAERLMSRNRWEPTTQAAQDCVETPGLLAARANATITNQQNSQLDGHLATCLVCRAVELRAVRADRAFAGTMGLALNAGSH